MKRLISLLLILLFSISLVSAGGLSRVSGTSINTNDNIVEIDNGEDEETEEKISRKLGKRTLIGLFKKIVTNDLIVNERFISRGYNDIPTISSKSDITLDPLRNVVMKTDAVVLYDNKKDSKLTIQRDFDTGKRWLIQSGWLKLLGHDGLELEATRGSVIVKSQLDAWDGFTVSAGRTTFVPSVLMLGPLNVMNDAKFKNIKVEGRADIAHLYTRSTESDVTKTRSLFVDGQLTTKTLKVGTVISDLITEGWIKGKKVIATDGAEIDDVIIQGKHISTRDGSASGLILSSDAGFVMIDGFATINDGAKIANGLKLDSGDLRLEPLSGPGKAYLCVEPSGVVYRSLTPCV